MGALEQPHTNQSGWHKRAESLGSLHFVDGDATPFVFDCVAVANERHSSSFDFQPLKLAECGEKR